MRVELGVVRCHVAEATVEELSWIDGYLRVPNAAGARWGEDDSISEFDVGRRTFAAGLLPLVRRGADADGVSLDVVDVRPPGPPLARDPDLGWLRDDQLALVRIALAAERGVLWAAVAMGKTEVAIGIARSVDCPWLLVVHRTTLARQAAERWDLREKEHGAGLGRAGLVADGEWAGLGARFVCATFASLAASLRAGDGRAAALLRGAGGLLVDEAHVVAAETYHAVVMVCGARYRIGLSGTPFAQGDRRAVRVVGALGPTIARVKASTLAAEGRVVLPRVWVVPFHHAALASRGLAAAWVGSYQKRREDRLVRSDERNSALVRVAKLGRDLGPTLLFVREVAHGTRLTKDLLRAGVAAEWVFGAHSTDQRRSLVRRLESGSVEVLVCSVVFQEGLDVPSLRAVVVGAGGASVVAAIQRVGRGMRTDPKSGKDGFDVFDLSDEGDRILERHAKARIRAYKNEGYSVARLGPEGRREKLFASGPERP